jgi:cell division protein FtsQ
MVSSVTRSRVSDAWMVSGQAVERLSAGLMLASIAALLYALLSWIASHPLFTVNALEVRGQLEHISESAVRNTVVRQMRGTLFTADLGQIKRLAETIPWVRRAQASRIWPNTVVLTLEEHKAFARLNNERLVNNFGEVFDVNMSDVEGASHLPLFRGDVQVAARMVSRYVELDTWLRTVDSPLSILTLSDRLSWSVSLRNGVAIELGRDTSPGLVQQRVGRLAATWGDLSRRAGIPSKIDLRYADGYTVQAPGLRIAGPQSR